MKRYTGKHVAITALAVLPFITVRCQPIKPDLGPPATTIVRCVEQPTEVTDETGCYRPVAPLALIGRCQTERG